jgi:hypothetical protein
MCNRCNCQQLLQAAPALTAVTLVLGAAVTAAVLILVRLVAALLAVKEVVAPAVTAS